MDTSTATVRKIAHNRFKHRSVGRTVDQQKRERKKATQRRNANKMKCNRELESNRYLYVKVFAFNDVNDMKKITKTHVKTHT